uniref:M50 family peptidase n=1 Tax=Schlesneria paludicola TaxID=360056 RepID=A0A7C2NWU9_9PLAN
MRNAAYLAALLWLCWTLMQAVHELGHVTAALLTGGSVQRVVLHPLALSRTDVSDDPWPLVTVAAGPAVGVLLPLAGWRLAGRRPWPLDHLLKFFAGFCLIANGAYLAYGSFEGIGDAGELLRHGAPIWTLWLFGAVTIPAGLLIGHRLGPRLGLHRHAPPLRRRHLAIAWGSLLAVTVVECLFSAR